MSLWRRQKPALLVLEDGSVYPGSAFAGAGEALGEVVFNTGMTGYQEILTDPSYKAQIVTMTYPLIGNTGINDEDMESDGIYLEGFIVREYSDAPSNWRSRRTLKAFLEASGALGVEGLDTRALTRRLRLHGAMRGILSTETRDIDLLLERVRAWPGLIGRDLIREVTCRASYRWFNGSPSPLEIPVQAKRVDLGAAEASPPAEIGTTEGTRRLHVVVMDCGVKYNILRCLEQRGCDIRVLPATATGEEILACRPDGVLFSNGPGDPSALPYLVAAARCVLGKAPLFGICLGHQILGQALGATTGKLKFGHHGVNQPVKNEQTGRIEITSQNHGFHVLAGTLPAGVDRSHTNLNDRTSEGLDCPDLGAFSVQYHPEAAPGPHDAAYLFDRFVELMMRNSAAMGRNPKNPTPSATKENEA
jgi:carbamoyl-phosphate synthase small subunit